MIIEAAQNTIGHNKYLLNENNKIVERHNREINEDQNNMGRDA